MANNTGNITVIGGGLAGCEAAWQAAQRGVGVSLMEMKPLKFSPAHEMAQLGELVCSNSLRSNAVDSAAGLLKEEMRLLDSLVMRAADQTAVPAGKALAVDRQRFATQLTAAIESHPLITVSRQEAVRIPETTDGPVILAAGPLLSGPLAEHLRTLTGDAHLAFYDAIAPIVDADSLDLEVIYRKSRWDEEGQGDYLNCPMDREQYERFVRLLGAAQTVPLHTFEDPKYFEGCLPIEVMCARGLETLRYGPMKPVGLAHPVTGELPYAVVQLRMENREGTAYNLVGFQTKLTYPEQQRVFRTIPGLERAVFLRLGSIHRNTFVCAPRVLDASLQLQRCPGLFVAGQLSGVEGYIESAAMGLLAGINAARMALGQEVAIPPGDTAHGTLICHLTASDPTHFQPSNVNFGLFPPLAGRKIPRKMRGQVRAEQALQQIRQWRRLFSEDPKKD
ncbi:methylenetetrahydrofolate--tRNA-(uracil(54)-C(5))-methyltransferase (FADH(2)-oxidizing) TrmFO [Desulfobulbus sp.]|uniref:methylenetetrahydrofolate--tRNA-(uracil(54)- C(5))-methyltransferase (FADH(2)-oxidizing) TrmFO n=1 Tax=Desulfobulbus sp. TaxID=895 RepID=UPI00286F528C|nr:methylenetetrahydrofolate--tRNA-(uracil(54)-C(5))-methyltransferase (FADH(2)-oxidizing) TrmFO [Desulfobulbus sp.]